MDDENKLKGSLSDGDIRRWLMNSGELSAPILKAMNSTPSFLFAKEIHDATRIMKERSISAVPIINEDKII